MRLLNYWGYDVANFDSAWCNSAQEPNIPLFYSEEYASSDVIGTFGGSLPGALHNKWGVVSVWVPFSWGVQNKLILSNCGNHLKNDLNETTKLSSIMDWIWWT